ncbi:hypothetical protein [Thermosyntropha sp.]|uniref:hypothetical protein n=1 Tax=Thermosyntropha sp. TaxID=2740820 RepID=UPI0025EC5A8D|nr:hypothetical protein [Thermosyntropha sp.]MBO8159160.1 hypothetical protein [Thermosyntropha sp.]
MARIDRLFVIIVIVLLVAMGLNISNYGINQLTMEDRGAVIDVEVDEGKLVFTFLGSDYAIKVDKQEIVSSLKEIIYRVEKHFYRIRHIFEVVFLYDI